MWRVLPLLALVLIAAAGVIAYVAVIPEIRRRDERRQQADRRREEIEDAQHQWGLDNVRQTREDLKRHRERLERGLDELHDGTSPHPHDQPR